MECPLIISERARDQSRIHILIDSECAHLAQVHRNSTVLFLPVLVQVDRLIIRLVVLELHVVIGVVRIHSESGVGLLSGLAARIPSGGTLHLEGTSVMLA
jgi:hypothetical protein